MAKFARKILMNGYNVPIMKDEEAKAMQKHLIAVPCSVCNAKAGRLCVRDDGTRKTRGVHMGRLPDGFNSLVWLENYLKKQGEKAKKMRNKK